MAHKDRANLCDVIESRPGWKVLKDPVLQKVPSLFVARCHSPRSCLANRHMASLISMFVHGVVVLSFCGCVARACMRVLFSSSVRRSNEHLLQVVFLFRARPPHAPCRNRAVASTGTRARRGCSARIGRSMTGRNAVSREPIFGAALQGGTWRRTEATTISLRPRSLSPGGRRRGARAQSLQHVVFLVHQKAYGPKPSRRKRATRATT